MIDDATADLVFDLIEKEREALRQNHRVTILILVIVS
jgi:hypothetical protein